MSNIKVMRAWDKGRNKIAYVYRDPETGNTKIGEEKFINWFYLKLQDYEKYKGILLKFKSDGTILGFEKEHRYVKVFIEFNHNSELLNKDMEWVWEYKNFKNNEMFEKLKMMGIQTYEADVKAFKRWLLREHVEIETEYKVLYYDIETDDRHSDALIPGKYRILSVAMKSSDDKNLDGKMMWIYTKEDTDEAEKEMLEKLASVINKHDVIISFNGSNFDDPYIKSRFVRYGIKIDWRKKFFQDQCWAMKKYGPSFSSYSLDNLSKNILKRGKVEHSGLRVWDMWKNNLKLLKEYNIEDVQLMYEMECKTGYLGSHREICAAGMCPVDDLYVSRKIDNFILKQAEEDGHYHFKTLEWQDENAESNDKTYEGAYVFPPVEGRHEHVRVVDFASLYPNVINTFNISPDTLIEDDENIPEDMIIKTPTRHRYRKDFIGILPKVVMRFADRRNYFKNLMSKETPGTVAHMVLNRKQYLYKYFGLSFYGCMGEKHSRAYDIRVAESITLCGQYFIKKCAEYLVKNNITINYGDTDSLFLANIPKHSHMKLIADKLTQLCDLHAKKYFNCDICTIKMEYDKGFKTFLIRDAKKRYAGVLDYLDGHAISEFNMYVAGFECKRTDSCQLLRDVQYKLLRMILEPQKCPDVNEIRSFIMKLKEDCFANRFTIEDITLSQRLTKEIDEYHGRQMHIMVAKEMMEDGKEVWLGDKIPYFIIGLDTNKKPIPKPVYKFEGRYCESYYWNNKIFPALMRVLQVVYPKIDWESYKAHGVGEVKVGKSLW